MKGPSCVMKKSVISAESVPQGLKPDLFWTRDGTTEVVPFRGMCARWNSWQAGTERTA
jgi:hypothetical protein